MPRPRHNPADEEPAPDPVETLAPGKRAVLDRALAVLAECSPEAGALGDLPQVTVPSSDIESVCQQCRDDDELDCKLLLCLACVDYEERFEVVYFLQSLAREQSLVIKTQVSYDSPSLPSVAGVWPAADWYEREAHDLFGVSFQGHPDLAPLLLYPEFEGYPGRKEFPFYEYREF